MKLVKREYNQLLDDITLIYEQSNKLAQKALDQIKTSAYWEIGKRIITVEQNNKLRAEYGEELIEELSRDLTTRHGDGFSATNLRYMRRFFLIYPIQHARAELSWTHYKVLLSVKNEKIRQKYEKKIQELDWSTRDLIDHLSQENVEREGVTNIDSKRILPKQVMKLTPKRGVLDLGRVIEVSGLHMKKPRLVVDLGFDVSTRKDFKEEKYQKGDVLQVIRKESGLCTFKKVSNTKKDLYAYKARILNVVDGDTLVVLIYFGDGICMEQRLRLRGVNAAELKTKKGQEAKDFLQRTVDGVEFIIIRTHGTDIYARYVADVFYLPGEENPDVVVKEGVYLNQELLDLGIADAYLGQG